jgi:predicted GNAT family acetyltransferase
MGRIDSIQVVELPMIDLEEVVAFLKRHEEYCLFLMSNLEKCGPYIGESPYSGNTHVLRKGGEIAAVFMLTREGVLVIYSELGEEVFEEILEKCLQEGITLRGITGKWSFCDTYWEWLKRKGAIGKETVKGKDILYSAEREAFVGEVQKGVRLLTAEDFKEWWKHRVAYCQELNLPVLLEEEKMQSIYLEKVEAEKIWGYFKEGKLIAMGDLNAKALDLAQVGGVYTIPSERRNGYSKRLMKHIIHESFETLRLRKLVLFTPEMNQASRRVYESLGMKHEGYYALFFAESG